MAPVKVPAQNHALFFAALPSDARIETIQMFGGVAAKVNGRVFAGLFGHSTMVLLPEPDRAAALKLEGAAFFDPMGNRRVRSEKVMLPENVMHDPAALRRWIARAFEAAARLAPKAAPAGPAAPQSAKKKPTTKKPTAKKPTTKKPTAKKPTAKKPPAKKPTAQKRTSH